MATKWELELGRLGRVLDRLKAPGGRCLEERVRRLAAMAGLAKGDRYAVHGAAGSAPALVILPRRDGPLPEVRRVRITE
jgi:hypothetical protein